mgnify:CR=1 FL=1
MYGAYHPMAIAAGAGRPAIAGRPLQEVVVGGPLCESGDVLLFDVDRLLATIPELKAQARAAGLPARFVIGYAPGNYDLQSAA